MSNKMIHREKCSVCKGDGWLAEPVQVDEYEWEQEQVECKACEGRGYFEHEKV